MRIRTSRLVSSATTTIRFLHFSVCNGPPNPRLSDSVVLCNTRLVGAPAVSIFTPLRLFSDSLFLDENRRWKASRQGGVTLSSSEAEFVAASQAGQEVLTSTSFSYNTIEGL